MSVGIDIGTSSIRAVEINRKGKSAKITRAAEASLPRGVVVGGEIRDPEAFVEILTELWKSAKMRSRAVHMAVSGKASVVRQMDLPYEDPETFRNALAFRVGDELPVDPDELTLDFHPMETFMDGEVKMQRCLIVGSYNMSVETTADILSDAGLRVIRADYAPFALIRLHHLMAGLPEIPRTDKDVQWPVSVIIDVGTTSSTIAIHYNARPMYIRTVDGGADSITQAVSEQLSISKDEAAVIQQQVFHSPEDVDPKTRKVVNYITKALVGGLVQAIRESVDFYATASTSMESIDQVFVSGGGTLAAGYVEQLASELAAPVHELNPIKQFGTSEVKKTYEDQGRRFAVAAGIALEVK